MSIADHGQKLLRQFIAVKCKRCLRHKFDESPLIGGSWESGFKTSWENNSASRATACDKR